MNRREFITLLGGAAVWPLSARAQQPTDRRIGVTIGSTSARLSLTTLPIWHY